MRRFAPAALIFHNFGWKLLSLATAMVLWLVLVGEQEMATSISAPIEFKNIPRDLEISSNIPEKIRLEIQGPVAKLTPASLSRASVIVDLGSVAAAGEQTFTINQTELSLPSGVGLNRAVPAQIRLRFERRVERELPVHIRLSGAATAGYSVTEQKAEPAIIRVIGPESRVRRLASAETDAIDLSGMSVSGDFETSVFVDDPQVRLVSSPIVRVKVKVEKIR